MAKEYWGGPWDVQGETHHVISTNKMKVGAVHCASTFVLRNGTKVLHASKGSFAHKKTVMMANFPGLVRDAFYWHSPNTEEVLHSHTPSTISPSPFSVVPYQQL